MRTDTYHTWKDKTWERAQNPGSFHGYFFIIRKEKEKRQRQLHIPVLPGSPRLHFILCKFILCYYSVAGTLPESQQRWCILGAEKPRHVLQTYRAVFRWFSAEQCSTSLSLSCFGTHPLYPPKEGNKQQRWKQSQW